MKMGFHSPWHSLFGLAFVFFFSVSKVNLKVRVSTVSFSFFPFLFIQRTQEKEN